VVEPAGRGRLLLEGVVDVVVVVVEPEARWVVGQGGRGKLLLLLQAPEGSLEALEFFYCCYFGTKGRSHKSPVYTNSGASEFCHVWLILPGCLSNFQIGIFLSLHLILCNVMSVSQMLTKIGQMAWQNQPDSKNQTNFGCLV